MIDFEMDVSGVGSALVSYSVLDPRPNPTCCPCKRVMMLTQTLVYVEVRKPGAKPCVWSCSGYVCELCGVRVLANYSTRPVLAALDSGQDERRADLVRDAAVYMVVEADG